MRYIAIALILAVISLNETSFAATIKCYSNGRMIYSKQVHDVLYEDGLFAFFETYTNKAVLTSADCVVKIAV